MISPRPFDTFRIPRFLLLAALAAALPAQAETALKVMRLRMGAHSLKVEVARTDEERAKGLMFRKSLGRNDGMLFVFDEPAYHSMWMKNTLIPLSVAFVDAKGEILNILDLEPHSPETRMSAGPASYAIETNRGWFAERGLRAGDRVTGLPPPRGRPGM